MGLGRLHLALIFRRIAVENKRGTPNEQLLAIVKDMIKSQRAVMEAKTGEDRLLQ